MSDRTDTERLDWLQKVKWATFLPRNGDNKIAAIELFTIPTQAVRGNTVREAIDAAMDHERMSLTDPQTRWQVSDSRP